jgi:hypothetical protein
MSPHITTTRYSWQHILKPQEDKNTDNICYQLGWGWLSMGERGEILNNQYSMGSRTKNIIFCKKLKIVLLQKLQVSD